MPNIVQLEKARTETITNCLKNEKMTHISTIKEDLEPWDDCMGDGFGLLFQQISFMAGKEIRDIGDRRELGAYTNDQDYVPRKQKIIKPAMKWKEPVHKPKEFKFSADTNQSKSPWETQQEA